MSHPTFLSNIIKKIEKKIVSYLYKSVYFNQKQLHPYKNMAKQLEIEATMVLHGYEAQEEAEARNEAVDREASTARSRLESIMGIRADKAVAKRAMEMFGDLEEITTEAKRQKIAGMENEGDANSVGANAGTRADPLMDTAPKDFAQIFRQAHESRRRVKEISLDEVKAANAKPDFVWQIGDTAEQ